MNLFQTTLYFCMGCLAVTQAYSAVLPAVDELPPLAKMPDPLVMQDGTKVQNKAQWEKRREEIREVLAYYEYGHMAPAPGNVKAENIVTSDALNGDAILRRMTLTMGPENKIPVETGMLVPKKGKGPFPVVLAIEPVWDPALEAAAKEIVGRGYIFAGYSKEGVDKDDADRSDGVHPLYPEYDWATLAAWAWGASRVVDYLITLPEVDKAHIALTGHSRCGKTTLLAGANDERIALVIPHASGCGGAGNFHIQGENPETLDLITRPDRFHYWFQPRLRDFVGKEDRLPFDQHFLKALIAPRPVVSLEALGDLWANPRGTAATWRLTQPVYDFLSVPNNNVLWYRQGGHSWQEEDWKVLMDFADHFFFGKPVSVEYNNPPFPKEEWKGSTDKP